MLHGKWSVLGSGQRKRIWPFRWQKEARSAYTWAKWNGTGFPLRRSWRHRSRTRFLHCKRGPWSARPPKRLQHHQELRFPGEKPGHASNPWWLLWLPPQVRLRPHRKKLRQLSHAPLLGWIDGHWHCTDLCIMCSIGISHRPRTNGTLQVYVNHLQVKTDF